MSKDLHSPSTNGPDHDTPDESGEANDKPSSVTRRQLLQVGWSVPVIAGITLPQTAWGGHLSAGSTYSDHDDGWDELEEDRWDYSWEELMNWWEDWWQKYR